MLSDNQARRVAVIGHNRIPFARHNTFYTTSGNIEMMTAALNGLVDKYGLQGQYLGEVAGGAVIKHSWEINLMRESALGTSIDPATPCCDIQQACNTGIEAAIYIANKISLGQIEVGIAGGVDSASNVPLVLGEKLRKILLSADRAPGTWTKIRELLKIRPGYLKPAAPENREPRTGLSMGGHAELAAQYYDISREDQDRYALESHQKMAKAYDKGFFADMMTAYMGLDHDNNLRRDTNYEKLARLKPAFDKEKGTLTAGNSSPLTDGASCVLISSETWARERGLPVMAYISYAEVAAIEYVKNRQNLLMAPVYATARLLAKAGLRLQDFDFYEIHEAFAAQVLAMLKIWNSPDLLKPFGIREALGTIDLSRLNVNGSSLAAGHPFAATGGRIIGTLAKLLHQKGRGRGFISVCAAGGQGGTMIMEK